MSPRLTELLREYWLLNAAFERGFGREGQQAAARIRAIEREIRLIASAENRCTACLMNLADADPAEIRDGVCGPCLAEEPR